MRLFEGIPRFARSGASDITALQGDMAGAFQTSAGRLPSTLHSTGKHHSNLRCPAPFTSLSMSVGYCGGGRRKSISTVAFVAIGALKRVAG